MKKSLYIEIAIILFILFVGGGILGSVLIKSGVEESSEGEVIEREVNNAPAFMNMAPLAGEVGQEYLFLVKVLDSDNPVEELSISLVEAPIWLSIDEFTISGTPTIDNVGTHEVVLELTDGENIVYNTFYILIEG